MEDALTQEQEQEYRDQLAREMWGGEEPEEPRADADPANDPEGQEDPIVSMQRSIDALAQKVSAVDSMGHEIQMWGGRISALQRDLQLQANQAAKQVQSAPSKEQIEAAARDDQEYAELREEFPEWANALDKRTNAVKAELLSEINNIRAQQPQVDFDGFKAELKREYEMKLLTVKHPSWRQVVNSPEYSTWLDSQPEDMRRKALESTDAIECIEVLDKFEQRTKKSAAGVAAERQQRLASSVSVQGGKRPVRSKSVEDMTDAEYREYLAKQYWSE